MAPQRHSRCKECGTDYPLDARYVCESCFGPLEVAYARGSSADAAELRRKIQAGPRRGSGATPTSCRSTSRPRDPLEPGLTPLVRADRLAERLGLGEVWVKNDAANPTHSFKDRVVAVAVAKAQELGFETVACASTGNLANAVAAHAAAAGLDSYVFVPADLEEQKLLATGVYGTNLVGVRGNYDDVNRLCTQLCEERPVGVRQRQPAPVLRRGLEDPRLRDGRAARLDAARPGRLPDRVGLAVHEDRPRLQRVARPGPRLGRAPGVQRRPGDGCSPVATAYAEGWDVCKPQKPDDDRQEPGDREPGRRAVRARARAPHRRRGRLGHRRRDPRRDPPAGGDDRDLHRDRGRRHHRDPARSSPSAAISAAGERVVAYITGEGLKTLDAVRESFHMHEIDPSVESLDAEFAAAGAGAAQ